MITFSKVMRYVAASLVVWLTLASCKDLSGNPPLPAGTVDPGIIQNTAGALQTAAAAEIAFQQAFATYIQVSGLLTDELTAGRRNLLFNASGQVSVLTRGYFPEAEADARQLDQNTVWNDSAAYQPVTNDAYNALQSARGLSGQAIGGLATYAPDTLKAIRGQIYAILGYAELMLADLFCSGIPLSTLDYQRDFTYSPSLTTSQVYQHAIALFDTAITLAADSARTVNLARVGQGRAYLALGQSAAAAQAVANVPSNFLYTDSILVCGSGGANVQICTASGRGQQPVFALVDGYSVSDREGGTGLPFVSSGDPRTADTVIGTVGSGSTLTSIYEPKKYNSFGISVVVLASGLEAQLITAEADLNAGNASAAFTILNALRTTSSLTAGKLPPLTDPGTFGAELDTLFTERAAWLFDDGHRQGDLRRLVRNYVNGQGVTVVANQYPSGMYPGLSSYDPYVDAPLPATELANPFFSGCLSRD